MRYADAAQYFANAAKSLPQAQEAKRLLYLRQEAGNWYSQGDEFGDNPALKTAIQLYTKLLDWYPRERVPLDWAMTQNNLGNALSALGERESGTDRLEQAVQAHREALKEYTQKRVPLDWAMTQSNLGRTLSSLGERESGTGKLEEAETALQNALDVAQASGASYYIHVIQSNLQNVRAVLAKRRSEPKQSVSP